MEQQEDFRTPAGTGDGAAGGPAAPLFDERSARTAAPVVPLEKVARRERFARWTAGGWRETVNSPRFRRSWPLALLLLATLAAAVAATNFYSRDDTAQRVAPATVAPAAANGNETAATADAGQTARNESDNSREARDARGEDTAGVDEKSVGNPEVFAAATLGNLLGGADAERGDAVATGGGERDKGKRQKRSKRRQGARRGGAILFDVIR
jgi:hypothetical protein